jgi:hypothetical protein
MKAKIAIVLCMVVLLSSCSTGNKDSVIQPLDKESSSVSSESTFPSESSVSDIEEIDNESTGQEKYGIFPHIYEELVAYDPYAGDYVLSFSNDSAAVFKPEEVITRGEYNLGNYFNLIDLKDEIALGGQGAYGGEFVVYNLLTNKCFVSKHYNSYGDRLEDNGIIDIIQFGWISRPIFLNSKLEELPLTLDFDYGESFRAPFHLIDTFNWSPELSWEPYVMIGITYNVLKDQYIAVYSLNPFYGVTDGLPNENQCEMGIAVFDAEGNQLERYSLPGTVYPPFYISKGYIPMNMAYPYVFGNNLLIVGDGGLGYEGMAVLVNLDTHEARQPSDDEIQKIATEQLNREAVRLVGDDWELKEILPPSPFHIVEKDEVQYIYLPDNEDALFAIPKELQMIDWSQTEDGMYHAVFSSSYE